MARWISLLFSLCDIAADSLCRAFHRFGRNLQIGQNLHLLAAMIEGGVLADERLHATHTGGELSLLDVQFDIGGELSVMAVGAKIIGTRHFHWADCSQHGLGTELSIRSPATTIARDRPPSAAGAGNFSKSVNIAAPARCMADRTAISMASRSKRPLLRRS